MFGKYSSLFFSKIQEDFCLKKIKANSTQSRVQRASPLQDQTVNMDGFEDHMVSSATTQWTPQSSRQYVKDGWDQSWTSAVVCPPHMIQKEGVSGIS